MDALDNAVWHSLTSAHAALAEGGPLARRYPADMSPFAALADSVGDADDDAWDALRDLVGPGEVALLFRRTVPLGNGWERLGGGVGHQMIGPHVVAAPEVGEPLTTADAPEMLALAKRTQPGPFRDRTGELGPFVGVRDRGVLVAMAGTRLHLDGYCEISAVCTDEAYRGHGYASALVQQLCAQITARGETPMLHVAGDNVTARRVYEKLGFTVRADMEFVAVRAPS